MERGFTVRSDSGGDESMRGWWYDTRWFDDNIVIGSSVKTGDRSRVVWTVNEDH